MPTDPLHTLSVVTPVLNAAQTLPATLRSVQMLPPDQTQHIVVDGGSTDGTLQTLQGQPGLTLLHQPDTGISEALNQALSAVSGKFVVVLNADDYFLPQAGDVLAHLNKANADTVFFSDIIQRDPLTGREVTRHASMDPIAAYMSIYHSGMFVPKSIYDEVGGYDVDYEFAMDCEWVHRSLARGVQYAHLPFVSSCMQLRGKSHINTGAAMREFEQSAVGHGLIDPLRARWYRWRQTLFHQLLKRSWFQAQWLRG